MEREYGFVYKALEEVGYDKEDVDALLRSFKGVTNDPIVKMADDDFGGLWWTRDENGNENLWEALGSQEGGFRWYDVTEEWMENYYKEA